MKDCEHQLLSLLSLTVAFILVGIVLLVFMVFSDWRYTKLKHEIRDLKEQTHATTEQ